MIKACTPLEREYPKLLMDLADPPAQVFVKGKYLPKDELGVAIVGSRIASEYGKKRALEFASALAKVNFTIISGLARGIDTVAHESALEVGGRTIAVLGGSVEKIYPPENLELAEKISKNGCVISEYPNGSKPYPQNFLARNRIIAALSKAVVVIEGKRRSGTLSTAKYAAELGREVFAVRGQVNSPLGEAAKYLIDNGAKVANSPEDLFEILI